MPFGLNTKSLVVGVVIGYIVVPFAAAKLRSVTKS